MPIPGSPTPFYPRGLYDALDGTVVPDGACFILANLIHDITTPRTWTPRAGATEQTDFPGFNTPGVVSAGRAVGSLIYGMIASARFPGHDEPFVYDVNSGTFLTVGNVTSANTPLTQASTGAWTPPTMDVVGSRVLVTHPGFYPNVDPFIGIFFGWFDTSSFSLDFTGDTNGTETLQNLSINPLDVGIQVGQLITGADIPAGTYVTSFNATIIVMSQAATGSTIGEALNASGGTPTAPLWGAGNTNTNPLPDIPTNVFQFNNRAYFAVKNQAWFTDALLPTNIAQATNFLTCGDAGLPINGFGGIPISQTTGGILAAMIIFKPAGGYYQLTGDASNSTLVLNGPIGNIGLAAQRSIVQTPRGLWFMSGDGVRQIDFTGLLSIAPVKGVRYPFTVAVEPSRACAAYNDTVYRISAKAAPNHLDNVPRLLEWWYDFEIDEWSGPHTCGNSLCISFENSFLFASVEHPAKLYMSSVEAHQATEVFTEFGVALSVLLKSCQLPQMKTISAYAVVESTIDLSLAADQSTPTAAFFNESNNVLGIAPIAPPPNVGAIWGQFLWGFASWGSQIGFASYNVDWPEPMVFKKGSIQITSGSYEDLHIGAFWYRLQDLGYINTQNPP